MISKSDIKNLAELSRLTLGDAELASLEKDLASILDYVGQVSRVAHEVGTPPLRDPRNVLRDDEPGIAVGGSREALLDAAPRREGDYIAVRAIISRDEPAL